VCNIGDRTLSANTPIAFYNDDPTSSAGATLMLGIQTLGTNIEVGNCALITYRVQGASGDVYAVVNCDNSVPPVFDFNTDFPMTVIGECDYTNNMDSRPVVVLLGESDLVFDAKKVEETVHLYWSFGANNAEAYQAITVERSRNGIDFYTIQTELDPKDLRFVDEDPKQGINYYRLKVYEKSGTFYYTHIEAFKFDGLSPINVQVFPNPFDQKIQLRFGDLPLSGKLSLTLINQLGQIVAEDQVVADNLALTWKPRRQLSAGSYWLKIVFDDQVMYKKVIKK
ncbi:MAG: T9SS type A sorting domain-containing protein, partial [Saprospiraceae bacterium]|nr:T9SS type A sorting domain-containing protein [Saprospiraceae bacterium]